MAHQSVSRFEDLKARVQALGCQLFIDDVEADDDPHYYIHDPKVGKHVIVGVPADEIEDWIETEKDVRDDTREVLADASADERFLSLIVIAGMGDRFKAMDVRRDKGVEAAIAFLGECKLSNEAPQGDGAEAEYADRLAAARAVDNPPHETTADRRERIARECDVDAAIHETEGVLWTVHSLAEIPFKHQSQGTRRGLPRSATQSLTRPSACSNFSTVRAAGITTARRRHEQAQRRV